jgi:orotidine-5'-phosphate decarboxylase
MDNQKLIAALDGMNRDAMIDFVENTAGRIRHFKIGMEAFYRYGRELVLDIHRFFDADIFLDLKLHDIPNTIDGAVQSLSTLPVRFLTLHLSGGKAMLEAAHKARTKYMPNALLLGVTYLTSLDGDDIHSLYGANPDQMKERFTKLVTLARQTGLDGLILSPHELAWAEETNKTGKRLLKVCPGIRFADEMDKGQTHDQKRCSTPEEALKNGADYLVIGRSLTQATDIDARLEQLGIE